MLDLNDAQPQPDWADELALTVYEGNDADLDRLAAALRKAFDLGNAQHQLAKLFARAVNAARARGLREAAVIVERGAFAGTRGEDAVLIRAQADGVERGDDDPPEERRGLFTDGVLAERKAIARGMGMAVAIAAATKLPDDPPGKGAINRYQYAAAAVGLIIEAINDKAAAIERGESP